MVMRPFTIPKMCRLDGTASLYHIGSTSCTVLTLNTNVKYAVTLVIGDRATLIAIFKSEQTRFVFLHSVVTVPVDGVTAMA